MVEIAPCRMYSLTHSTWFDFLDGALRRALKEILPRDFLAPASRAAASCAEHAAFFRRSSRPSAFGIPLSSAAGALSQAILNAAWTSRCHDDARPADVTRQRWQRVADERESAH